jgi:heptosyltransferase-2
VKRILVIRGGAIGDFVLTLPALKLLRDAFAESHIEILGYKHIVALAEKRFYADAVRSIEYGPLAGFFARGGELALDLAEYFSAFDLVVSYLFDPDRVFEQNMRRCGVDNFVACTPKIEGDRHAALQLARCIEQQLGLRPADPAAALYPSSDDRAFANQFVRAVAHPICAIHPGSGSAAKNWPVENWRTVSEQLMSDSAARSLLIVGGEADEGALREVRAAWRDDCVVFAENLPLPHLAAVLERCVVFLGHDSGISHIAAAVGAPSVLLFGPTDPNVWAPANAKVRVIRAPAAEITGLSVQPVCEVARRIIANAAANPSS